MNDIQQYRKASAEWMGWEIKIARSDGVVFYWPDPSHKVYYEPWRPDIDHNQMAMMIDKLNKYDYDVLIRKNSANSICDIEYWQEQENDSILLHHKFQGRDKDIRIAFMKAWTEYYKQK